MRELAWEGLGDPKGSSESWGILEDPGGQSYQSYQSDQSYQSTLYIFLGIGATVRTRMQDSLLSMNDVFFCITTSL